MDIFAVPGENVRHEAVCPPKGVKMNRDRESADEVCKDNGDGTGIWVIPNSVLIRRAREAMSTSIAQGVEYKGNTYAIDKDDRSAFLEGLTFLDMMNFPNCNVWDKNGTKHTVTAAEYRELCATIATRFAQIFETFKIEVQTINERS